MSAMACEIINILTGKQVYFRGIKQNINMNRSCRRICFAIMTMLRRNMLHHINLFAQFCLLTETNLSVTPGHSSKVTDVRCSRLVDQSIAMLTGNGSASNPSVCISDLTLESLQMKIVV